MGVGGLPEFVGIAWVEILNCLSVIVPLLDVYPDDGIIEFRIRGLDDIVIGVFLVLHGVESFKNEIKQNANHETTKSIPPSNGCTRINRASYFSAFRSNLR